MHRNRIKLSVVAITAFGGMVFANSLSECKADGYLRAGFQNHKIDNKEFKDLSIGAKLHIENSITDNISWGASFYASNKLKYNDGMGVPFFDSNNNSYAILGEAYIESTFKNSSLKIGRQELDTPFADSDDIAMIPNSFEAAIFTSNYLANSSIFLGYIKRWAGVDAPKPEKFTSMQNGKGVGVFGITYEGINNLKLSSWYYKLNSKKSGDLKNILYLEATYSNNIANNIEYEVAFQYAKQSFLNQQDANILGANLSINSKNSGLSFDFAYNRVTKNSATNGFGGGAFFTSAEHLTIDGMGSNIKAYKAGFKWDASAINLNGLSLEYNYLKIKSNNKSAKESDYLLNYEINKNLNLSLIYSDAKDYINSEKFKNLRFFANYTF